MRAKGIAILRAKKDYDVAMMELKLVGLREVYTEGSTMGRPLEDKVADILHFLGLRGLHLMGRHAFDDEGSALYVIDIFDGHNELVMAIVAFEGARLRRVVRRLAAHGWNVALFFEVRKARVHRHNRAM